MSGAKFTLKELKDRIEDGELDLSLSTITEDTLPIMEMNQLKRFQVLDLSCNIMKSLPVELCSFTQLTKLDVSKNLLSQLPDNIGELSNLQCLDLLGNKLTTLPESFGDLSQLRWLDVRENPLSVAILKEAGDCLDDRQCKMCAIQVVKLMNYVHVEREKKRVAERQEKEAELEKAAQEERQVKKRLKQEEKERKRQEYLERQRLEGSSGTVKPGKGDTQPSKMNDAPTECAHKNGHQGESILCTILSMLSILLVITSGTLCLALGLYYYCEATPAEDAVSPICTSQFWFPVRDYIEDILLPYLMVLQNEIQLFMNR
ncbi:leucine-rich repeat-containing protein 59-like [Watersipora subatra]|uniref:leucine-rich repeat-containing protein 59-like n=1 Tax=Watersipora subatra TaxID=2589382 RepID=UPI00355C8151